ncbi:hypothetical protein BZA05DRAFT_380830 [Tricharina praecox]|uniref:uncharacterized protein n=1 Tax=Tricharina praecox TaxID=43433 RepID=UPI002220CBEA|nr:uncharacterized protein BZA05DRAFT_380830 [Tricharina praecox]KAI5858319.1 hypothetical protein BZA05DRAFT_380830 [Tricharina praecox]
MESIHDETAGYTSLSLRSPSLAISSIFHVSRTIPPSSLGSFLSVLGLFEGSVLFFSSPRILCIAIFGDSSKMMIHFLSFHHSVLPFFFTTQLCWSTICMLY